MVQMYFEKLYCAKYNFTFKSKSIIDVNYNLFKNYIKS